MPILLALLLSVLGHRHTEVDYASIFATKKDKWAGGASICLWRRIRATDHIIAHRTLPCGTTVFIYNPRTKLSTLTLVGDHGPYGACLDNNWEKGTPCRRWVLKRKEGDPGIWRGAVDLTPSVANAIGQNGFELIEMTVVEILPSSNFFVKLTRPRK